MSFREGESGEESTGKLPKKESRGSSEGGLSWNGT